MQADQMTQTLRTVTSLWAMQPHDQTGIKLPYEQVCEMVAEAGYDGMAIDLGAGDVAQAHEVRPHMERYGLTPLIVAFPKSVESLRETLVMAKDFGSPFVDVIGQVMPLSVDGMIPVIRQWMDMADEIGVPIQFETHRNCITNDLYSTLCLLDDFDLKFDPAHPVHRPGLRLDLGIELPQLPKGHRGKYMMRRMIAHLPAQPAHQRIGPRGARVL